MREIAAGENKELGAKIATENRALWDIGLKRGGFGVMEIWVMAQWGTARPARK